jgi:hypothetical protein
VVAFGGGPYFAALRPHEKSSRRKFPGPPAAKATHGGPWAPGRQERKVVAFGGGPYFAALRPHLRIVPPALLLKRFAQTFHPGDYPPHF